MRNFILGTDWGEDCDDCVAVRILARAYKKGEINFLGIGINTLTEYSAPSLYRFLEKEGGVGIMDLGSTNGTSLNGIKLKKEEVLEIVKNDEILIGNIRLLVV